MTARNKIINIFDVSGGIAGASMILAAVLLLVSAPGSSYKLLQLGVAVLFLCFGAMLAVHRELRRTRVVIGAIFLVCIVGSFIAALLLPNRFNLR